MVNVNVVGVGYICKYLEAKGDFPCCYCYVDFLIVGDLKVRRDTCSTIRLAQNAIFTVVLIFCEFFIFKEFFENFVVFIGVFIFKAVSQDFVGQHMCFLT